MKKILLAGFCSALMLFGSLQSQAQKALLDGVIKVKLEGTVEIKNNGAIVGYGVFYQLEKSKKTALYRIDILDENLKKIGSSEFEGDDDLELVRGLYESNLIMLAFQIEKKKGPPDRLVKVFDLKGREKGEITYDPERVKKGMFGAAVAEQMESMYNGYQNVEGKGFAVVYQSQSKFGGADIQMIGTNGKLKWERNIEEDGKRMDVYLTGTTPNALMFFAAIRKNIMNADAELFIIGLNPDNGKEIFRKPMDPRMYSYEPLLFKTDAAGGAKMVSLISEKEQKFYKALPIGFSVANLNDKTGEIKIEKDFLYANDLGSVLDMKSEAKSEEGFMKIHNIEVFDDGSKVVVGEFFRRTVSALGAAAKIMSRGGGTATQLSMGDLFFLRIDANNKVTGIEKIEKKTERYGAPGDGITIGLLARYLSQIGAFSYMYTDDNSDPAKRTVLAQGSFEGEGYGTTAITFDKNKGFTKKKFELVKERKKDQVRIFRGKPGHVMIMKYDSKAKTIAMNLERVQS